jgi:hypothetical protein
MLNAVTKEYGDYLNTFDWTWYCILTFRYPLSPGRAWHIFNNFKIKLKKAGGNPIPYFYVRELENWNYNPHLHVFLSGTSNLNTTYWKQCWFLLGGLAEKIEPYNPDLGAKYYLGNKWVSDTADIKFSYNLPNKRIMAL